MKRPGTGTSTTGWRLLTRDGVWIRRTVDDGGEPVCRVFLHRRDGVAVRVERDRDRGVAQPLLHDLRVDADYLKSEAVSMSSDQGVCVVDGMSMT